MSLGTTPGQVQTVEDILRPLAERRIRQHPDVLRLKKEKPFVEVMDGNEPDPRFASLRREYVPLIDASAGAILRAIQASHVKVFLGFIPNDPPVKDVWEGVSSPKDYTRTKCFYAFTPEEALARALVEAIGYEKATTRTGPDNE